MNDLSEFTEFISYQTIEVDNMAHTQSRYGLDDLTNNENFGKIAYMPNLTFLIDGKKQFNIDQDKRAMQLEGESSTGMSRLGLKMECSREKLDFASSEEFDRKSQLDYPEPYSPESSGPLKIPESQVLQPNEPLVQESTSWSDDQSNEMIIETLKSTQHQLDLILEEIEKIAPTVADVKVEVSLDKKNNIKTAKAKLPQEIQDLISSYLKLQEESFQQEAILASLNQEESKKTKKKQKPKGYNQKNFSKKIGDQFCDHLNNEYKMKSNKVLKDKTSWNLLNNLFEDNLKIDKKVPGKAIMLCFVNFMANYDPETIQRSKVFERLSKVCYTMNAVLLKRCCSEVKQLTSNGETLESFRIRRSWPKTVLEFQSN